MPVTVLSGDDHLAIRGRRATLLASSGADAESVSKYDLANPDDQDGLVVALRTVPLFGGPRYLEVAGLEHLDDTVAAALARTSPLDTVVVFGTKPSKHLPASDTVAVEQHATPTGAGVRHLAGKLASQHDLALSAGQLDQIARACAHDVPLLHSVMFSLALTGRTDFPDVLLARFTAAATAGPGTPWALLEALLAGRLGEALDLADRVEPLAALSYLSTRLGMAGRIAESGYSQPEVASGAVGVPSRAAAQALIDLADRLGPQGLAQSWNLIAAADIACKASPDAHLALDLALTQLCSLWSRPARTADSLPERWSGTSA